MTTAEEGYKRGVEAAPTKAKATKAKTPTVGAPDTGTYPLFNAAVREVAPDDAVHDLKGSDDDTERA
jgi:hypothetical protein